MQIMYTMKNFAAQQLSKAQMNSLRGGERYECVTFMNGERTGKYIVEANSPTDAADAVHSIALSDQVNCTRA